MLFYSLRQLVSVSQSFGSVRSRRLASRRPKSSYSMFESLEPRALLSSVSVAGSALGFSAAIGETNNVTVSESADVITITDTAGITAGQVSTAC